VNDKSELELLQNSHVGNLQTAEELCKIAIIANLQTAEWINNQHERMERGTKLLMQIATDVGKVLYSVQQQLEHDKFLDWLRANIRFSQRRAYNYISVFEYRESISSAENLTQAYKMIETIKAQEKQTETAQAYRRVADFRKTGEKPEGWRRGTDDKLAKEEEERDARIEAVKQEALARKERSEREEQEKERERERREAEREHLRSETDELFRSIEQGAKLLQERANFKEKIRLSAEGMGDPFQDALIDYLDGLADDNRRVEACYNIIKICKRIANDLQSDKTAAGV